MKSNLPSQIFTVLWDTFQSLGVLEQIVIRAQAERGEIRIVDAPKEVKV